MRSVRWGVRADLFFLFPAFLPVDSHPVQIPYFCLYVVAADNIGFMPDLQFQGNRTNPIYP